MPHDKSGNIVNKGDVVGVLFTVKDVQEGEEYCNCTLETILPMYPGEHATSLVINTKQCTVTDI